jgi:hypothetical protein
VCVAGGGLSRGRLKLIEMSHLARRRTSGVGPVQPYPSGRFDAFVDMGNPMKGINLFPYLRRRVEGRALRAMGPFEALELSRTVCETAAPRRWPREVSSLRFLLASSFQV